MGEGERKIDRKGTKTQRERTQVPTQRSRCYLAYEDQGGHSLSAATTWFGETLSFQILYAG